MWLVLTVGAATLFAGTLFLESRESLFPAIAKANKAMAMSRSEGYAVSPNVVVSLSLLVHSFVS